MGVSIARARRPLTGVLGLYRSSIGKKFAMAITGVILFGYVILHLMGNLKIYQGPEKYNAYAVFLRDVLSPVLGNEGALWIVRVILLAALVIHVVAAYQLTRQDWAGRPKHYSVHQNIQATYASRTMRWGGVIVFLFIVYHVLHLTTGTVHPDFRVMDAYHNVVSGFQVWYVSLAYIAALAALAFHLYHGLWSMFQTLGLNGRRTNGVWRWLATVLSVIFFVGNTSIPVSILLGVVR